MPRARIMVIEDSSSDIFLLRRALISMQGKNFDLQVAEDGARALELIHKQDGQKELHPCVILLDLHIPKHDGFEILGALRKHPAMGQIQVVVTTNGASPQEKDELHKMGFDCRPKPRNLQEFDTLAADLMAICDGTEMAN